ncbi:YggS family pyridoxal phosphate-dependent enzyme [Propylenella binzhouense]|uniref:Pyridoxal phosphate homeostasis protein n=1 Tax=Propylenella binzhouense TaxID=2555902 RepID=A0A964T1Q5_9HYPH|nr:YggS family pyridoxal phosphate-dependent enzyme [Propylenella binzhouense]MYZ46838.1 YggS family pyridoxal phosphate-dependent enzyme [Propylenella binzhouense]
MTAAERLSDVRARIEAAAGRAGRDPAMVTLVAVSKTFPAEAVTPLIDAGQMVFGENRVQEAARKWPLLLARHTDLRLHLIGPLQTNKTKDALALFHAIHSLDRDRLAVAIAREIAAGARTPELFVQVNTGEEPQKAGVSPREAAGFVRRCREVHGLAIDGLMCIPPVDDLPGPHFALLGKIGREAGTSGLSMGMSADFETAIAFGATHVRVGSALFGGRASPAPRARSGGDQERGPGSEGGEEAE